MRALARLIQPGVAAFVVMIPAAGKTVEYKPADGNFYLRSSVLLAEPSAVILSADEFERQGDSYLVHLRHKVPPVVYVEVMRDWLEPVTPPSMPDSLGIAPDVMQLREMQGDVQIELPSNPASFIPALEEMPVPNGTVVKTGVGGSVAVLFGGIDSARLAPNSEVVVGQTVTPLLRTTKVEIKAGAVFSKVGLRPGQKQDYQVHTPFGIALARGTDFVSVVLPDRTDVWIAQGTVRLDQPNGEIVGTAKAPGTGALKIVRYPVIADPHAAMMATTQTLTMAMTFMPMVNLKIKTLRDQVAQGLKLGSRERKYLSLIKNVPCLIKLAVVALPPSPAPPEKVPTAKPVNTSSPVTPPAPNPYGAPINPNNFQIHHAMGP